MAKTTIKTYFTGVVDSTGYNRIIRVNGSAEQCQGYVPNIVTLKYRGLSIPAEKKIIKHTIKLHLGSPALVYCDYDASYSAPPPNGYTVENTTSDPRKLEVNPTPAVPVRGFAYMQYTAGYANVIKEYNDMPDIIASGDWISLELPREQNLPSDGSIYLTQMSAYTPASNPIENRLPGKVAYKYNGDYYYNFTNYFRANFTD